MFIFSEKSDMLSRMNIFAIIHLTEKNIIF